MKRFFFAVLFGGFAFDVLANSDLCKIETITRLNVSNGVLLQVQCRNYPRVTQIVVKNSDAAATQVTILATSAMATEKLIEIFYKGSDASCNQTQCTVNSLDSLTL